MITETRIDAIIIWANLFGNQEKLTLRPISNLRTIWCYHIPTFANFCATGEICAKSAFSPSEAYDEAYRILSKIFENDSKHKHKVKSLNPSKAAAGDLIEIYKIALLFLFYIAITDKNCLLDFQQELQSKCMESVLADMLQQCKVNITGNSWWSMGQTRSRRSRSWSRPPNRYESNIEEVFTNSPKHDKLNSSISRGIKHDTTLLELLVSENNELRTKCERTKESANLYKEFLEDEETNRADVIQRWQKRIEEFVANEKKLKASISTLEQEKKSIETECASAHSKVADLLSGTRDWKDKANELEKEVNRLNMLSSKLQTDLENYERIEKSLRKQLDDANNAHEKNKRFLESYEQEKLKLSSDLNQLQQVNLMNKEELSFLREEKYNMISENKELKRQVSTLEKRLEDTTMKLENSFANLKREKQNYAEKLSEKESEFEHRLKNEKSIVEEIRKELHQNQEKLAELTNFYNDNISREKEAVSKYKQAIEEAEEQLLGKKREWDNQLRSVTDSHEREKTSLLELNDYNEKKQKSLTEELDMMKDQINQANDRFDNLRKENCVSKTAYEEKITVMTQEMETLTVNSQKKSIEANLYDRELQATQDEVINLESRNAMLSVLIEDIFELLDTCESFSFKFLNESLQNPPYSCLRKSRSTTRNSKAIY